MDFGSAGWFNGVGMLSLGDIENVLDCIDDNSQLSCGERPCTRYEAADNVGHSECGMSGNHGVGGSASEIQSDTPTLDVCGSKKTSFWEKRIEGNRVRFELLQEDLDKEREQREMENELERQRTLLDATVGEDCSIEEDAEIDEPEQEQEQYEFETDIEDDYETDEWDEDELVDDNASSADSCDESADDLWDGDEQDESDDFVDSDEQDEFTGAEVSDSGSRAHDGDVLIMGDDDSTLDSGGNEELCGEHTEIDWLDDDDDDIDDICGDGDDSQDADGVASSVQGAATIVKPVTQQTAKQEIKQSQPRSVQNKVQQAPARQVGSAVEQQPNKVGRMPEQDTLVKKAPAVEQKIDYSGMEIGKLWGHVMQFMEDMGVRKRPVDKFKLEEQFGKQQVVRLINQSYLIQLGGGRVTAGR